MPISETHNMDCMDYMAQFPDKHFELAIVDPPYGIGITRSGRLGHYGGIGKAWDLLVPNDSYFAELDRVSRDQIIWGGNYFTLRPTQCFLIWDKQQPEGISFASCEFAWTSFKTSARTFYQRPQRADLQRIHPTQKPVTLYKWILTNYAKSGDKILDTHLGSGSSRIAAWDLGFDFYATELDKDYFDAQEQRFADHIAQPNMLMEILPRPEQNGLF